jgi:hypothetical protein
MAKVRTTSGGTVEIKMQDLRGRQVRTRRAMSNAHTKLPAGSIVTVGGSWRSGVNLMTEPCGACGVSVFMSRVHRDDIELVET